MTITRQAKIINKTGLSLPFASRSVFSCPFLLKYGGSHQNFKYCNTEMSDHHCCYHCQFKTVFFCCFSKAYDHFDCQPFTTKQSACSTVGYFGNVVSRLQVGGGKGTCFYSQPQIISRIMFLKISNAITLSFLGFPYMVNVFAIVQALSLGAMECLWVVLFYGLEFRTARVLMFDLG